MPVSSIQIGGVELNDPTLGISVSSANYYSSPNKAINQHELAQTDGAVATFQKFNSKTIEIEGWIATENLSGFIAKVDQIKRQQALYGSDLVINEANHTRTYKECIVTNFDIDKQTAPNFANYVMTIWSPSPYSFGEYITAPNQIKTSVGSVLVAPYADFVFRTANVANIEGSGDILPIIEWQFTTTPSLNNRESQIILAFGNPLQNPNPAISGSALQFDFKSSNALSVNRNNVGVATGNRYEINCETNSITRNGNPIYVEGRFPYWTAGSSHFTIRVQGTTNFVWSINMGVRYRLRYL